MRKEQLVSQITVDEFGTVIYRTSTRVFDDDESLIAERFHRTPLEPGDDFSSAPQEVRDICAIAHTPQRIADRIRRRDESARSRRN